MEYAFKLSEVTAMQLACIKQLHNLKESIIENRRTRGVNRRASSMQNMGDIIIDIDKEIAERKDWAMHPEKVRI